MTPSPLVLIDGQPQIDGYNASAGQTITVSLASSAGVYAWNIICIGTDDVNTTAAVNATLSINQASNLATFTMPASAGSAVIFKSTINNGVDVNGLVQLNYSTTFGVYVLSADGFRLGAQNETTEGDAVYGWLSKINTFMRTASLPNPTITTDGYVLTVSATETISYQPIDLTGVGTVLSGILGVSHLPNLAGDVLGPITSNTLTLAGDVTGRAGITIVGKINGASVPTSGSLTTGNVLQVNGSSSLTYAPINLAGGSNYITGILPAANSRSSNFAQAELDYTITYTASSSIVKLRSTGSVSNGPTIDYSANTITANIAGYYRLSACIPNMVQYNITTSPNISLKVNGGNIMYQNNQPSSTGAVYVNTFDIIYYMNIGDNISIGYYMPGSNQLTVSAGSVVSMTLL